MTKGVTFSYSRSVRFPKLKVKSAPARVRPGKYTRKRAVRRPRTGTKTAYKKTKTNFISGGPVSLSFSTIPLGNKKVFLSKKDYQLLGTQTYVNTNYRSINWDTGLQNVGTIGQYYTIPEIEKQLDHVSNVGVMPSNNNAYKLWLHSMKANVMITNQTNDVIHVVAYDVVPRYSSIGNAQYDNPDEVWTYSNTVNMDDSQMAYIPGSTPFQNPSFTKFFKVVKVTDIKIQSGGHHEHKVKIKPLMMISRDFLNMISNSQDNGFIRNLTSFTMLVCHGFPLTNGSVVSTAAGKIDCVITRSYRFKYVPINNSQITYSSNLGTFSPTSSRLISDLVGSLSGIVTA